MLFCGFVKDVRRGNTQAGYMGRNQQPEVSTVPTYQNVSRQLGSKQKGYDVEILGATFEDCRWES
jgi:hypothetical protein